MSARLAAWACMLWCVVALVSPAAASASASPRYAIVIGNNATPTFAPELGPLRYADDDAVRYHALLSRTGVEVALLAVLDDATQRRDPERARSARPPTRDNLMRVLADYRQRMARDRAAGKVPSLHVIFSGHGARRPDGQYALALLDAPLGRQELFEDVLAPFAEHPVHLIVDACHAAGVVGMRGDDDAQAAGVELAPELLAEIAARESLERFPRLGVLLASTAGEEAHEWSQIEGGVFSHELLSALAGGADVNGDRLIEYSEVEAFVAAANHGLRDPRAVPRLRAHAPRADRRSALIDLRAIEESIVLTGSASSLGRFHVELSDGTRWAEAHLGAHVLLVVPRGAGHYLRTEHSEAAIPNAASVDIGALRFVPLRRTARGSVDDALRAGLFSFAYGHDYYRGYVDSRGLIGVDFVPRTPARRADAVQHGSMPWAIALLSLAGAALVTSGVTGYLALDARDELEDTELQRRAHALRDDYARWSAVSLVAAGVALAAGTSAIVLWPSTTIETQQATRQAARVDVQVHIAARF